MYRAQPSSALWIMVVALNVFQRCALGPVPSLQCSLWCISKLEFTLFLTKRYLTAPSRPEGALKELQNLRLPVSYRELSMMQIGRSVVNKKFTYFLPSRAAADIYFWIRELW